MSRLVQVKAKVFCYEGARGMEKRSLRSRIEKWEVSEGMVRGEYRGYYCGVKGNHSRVD